MKTQGILVKVGLCEGTLVGGNWNHRLA